MFPDAVGYFFLGLRYMDMDGHAHLLRHIPYPYQRRIGACVDGVGGTSWCGCGPPLRRARYRIAPGPSAKRSSSVGPDRIPLDREARIPGVGYGLGDLSLKIVHVRKRRNAVFDHLRDPQHGEPVDILPAHLVLGGEYLFMEPLEKVPVAPHPP